MAGQQQGFGRRGVDAERARPSVKSRNVIYREGHDARPTLHGSHIEVHWPKYLAAAGAVFALGYLVASGKRDPFGLVLVPVLFGAIAYFTLNGLRKSLNDVHTVRTQLFRSPAFLVGALMGLGYFVYSTFLSPQMIMGVEWGEQTVFQDGFQRQDIGAVALLALKAAGLMVLGGLVLEFIARRFLGAGEEE
jgi:hypothetical protein